jgi:hypothetical protein
MLIHSKCGSCVYIDLSKFYKIIANYGIDENNLTIGVGEIVPATERGGMKKTDFFCISCKETISTSELKEFCCQCGEIQELNHLYYCKQTGGIYCESCLKKLGLSGVPFSAIADRIQITK